jgi:hypothetical protein
MTKLPICAAAKPLRADGCIDACIDARPLRAAIADSIQMQQKHTTTQHFDKTVMPVMPATAYLR